MLTSPIYDAWGKAWKREAGVRERSVDLSSLSLLRDEGGLVLISIDTNTKRPRMEALGGESLNDKDISVSIRLVPEGDLEAEATEVVFEWPGWSIVGVLEGRYSVLVTLMDRRA